MPKHASFRKARAQLSDELTQRHLLLRRARVLRFLGVEPLDRLAPTDVADTYRVRIVAETVRPHLSERSPDMHRAITIDNIVITYIIKTTLQMPLANIRY